MFKENIYVVYGSPITDNVADKINELNKRIENKEFINSKWKDVVNFWDCIASINEKERLNVIGVIIDQFNPSDMGIGLNELHLEIFKEDKNKLTKIINKLHPEIKNLLLTPEIIFITESE